MAWAPAAAAQDPTPSPSTALSTAETGGVAILKKDPGGDFLAGATFTLFDSAGEQVGTGTTSADGQLAFKDLAPGVYRLKEVSSGSPLHDVVDDQDVIVTPGTDAPLTIIDPFKPATVTLKAKDSKSGKLLPGSSVNIGTGDTTVLILTTGSNGTASAKLPVNSRTGTAFWVKQTKAPDGYDLYKPSRTFTAKPADPVTVTVTNAKIRQHDTDAQILRQAVRQADHRRVHVGQADPGPGRQHFLAVPLAVRHRGRRRDRVEHCGRHPRGRARPHRC
jgi:uncharacterized surface anchored protein